MQATAGQVQREALPGEGEHFTVETFADRSDWLRGRMQSIGASEAPALWGCSRFASPLSLWAEKRGLADVRDESNAEAAEAGEVFEPGLRELYRRRTQRTIVYPGASIILRSIAWPWMTCSLDGVVFRDDEPGALECKFRLPWSREDWSERPPLTVDVQVQHQLAVTGWRFGSAAAWVGEFRWADLPRNDAFIVLHVEETRALWQRIESGERPDVDAHPATLEALKALYPQSAAGTTATLDEDLARWADALELARDTLSDAEAMERLASSKLRAAFGTAERGMFPDGSEWTCKTSKDGKRPLRKVTKKERGGK